MPLKQEKFRSRACLVWVKYQPSVISGLPADDPHHIKGHGQSATGATASDLFTFPLTRGEHQGLQESLHPNWRRWEMRWGSQWQYVLKTIRMALRDGVVSMEVVQNEIDHQIINSDDRAYFKEELGLDIEVSHD